MSPGRKPSLSPCLYGWTDKHDTSYLFVVERFDSCRNSKIGFAGSGRANSERQVVRANTF